jgi:hypothetical protein
MTCYTFILTLPNNTNRSNRKRNRLHLYFYDPLSHILSNLLLSRHTHFTAVRFKWRFVCEPRRRAHFTPCVFRFIVGESPSLLPFYCRDLHERIFWLKFPCCARGSPSVLAPHPRAFRSSITTPPSPMRSSPARLPFLCVPHPCVFRLSLALVRVRFLHPLPWQKFQRRRIFSSTTAALLTSSRRLLIPFSSAIATYSSPRPTCKGDFTYYLFQLVGDRMDSNDVAIIREENVPPSTFRTLIALQKYVLYPPSNPHGRS